MFQTTCVQYCCRPLLLLTLRLYQLDLNCTELCCLYTGHTIKSSVTPANTTLRCHVSDHEACQRETLFSALLHEVVSVMTLRSQLKKTYANKPNPSKFTHLFQSCTANIHNTTGRVQRNTTQTSRQALCKYTQWNQVDKHSANTPNTTK